MVEEPMDLRIRPTYGVPRLFWISGTSIVGLVDPASPYSAGGTDAELARLTPYDRLLISTALLHALDVVGRHIAKDRREAEGDG